MKLRYSLPILLTASLVACSGGGGGGDSSSLDSGITEVLGSSRPRQPLLKLSNLEYLGAFRVPQGTSDQLTFNYGGTALGFNPANRSLFITGHDWYQLSAEISIPTPSKASDVQSLPQATLIQGLTDATEGKLNQVHPSGAEAKVGGHLVYNGKLYISSYRYYDATDQQFASHFVRPLSLSTRSQVQGPITLQNVPARWVAGYMGLIPSEWQSALGGPVLTGLGGVPIAAASSVGPAAAVFDPSNLSKAATMLVGYPLGNSLAQRYGLSEAGGSNSMWNLTSQVRGVVFPTGSSSVLFIGRHGTGEYCYGAGGESGACYDPTNMYQGTHAYPYRYQVWAYDANDLADVEAGKRKHYEIQPYAVWALDLPYESSSGAHQIHGVAYDPSNQVMYISQACIGTSCAPIIHAFKFAL